MLKCRQNQGKSEIFDPVRKKWVRLTEEEKVRQYFISFLHIQKNIPLSHIAVEKKIKVNNLSRRYDIIVFDKTGSPKIVIECKAPHVKLSQEVIEQVGLYNKTLRAHIIGVTNGTEHIFFQINFETEKIKIYDF